MAAKKIIDTGTTADMERLLRHRTSKEYFKDGNWTADPQEASRFNDVIEVAETCTRYGLQDVELRIRHKAGCEVFSTRIR